MPARDVLRYPNPALKRTARELSGEDAELIGRVAADLVDTMRAHPGCVGLAAPQLDQLVRMVVVDCTEHKRAVDPNGLLVLVNPVVAESSGAEVAREGCLSIPDLTANVRRATEVVIEATDPAGESLRVSSVGFEARCLLHEIDHLDGILFLDRVDSLKTDVFRRKTYS
ncbi:MAG: peptide deformylase [Solirubrobacterales bacterium]